MNINKSKKNQIKNLNNNPLIYPDPNITQEEWNQEEINNLRKIKQFWPVHV